MPALNLSTNQKTLLDSIETPVDEAFGTGVTVAAAPYLAPMKNYATIRSADRVAFKAGFKQTFALLLAILGIDRIGVGTGASPVVVPLAKITGGGTDGSMTIVGGLIVSITQPT